MVAGAGRLPGAARPLTSRAGGGLVRLPPGGRRARHRATAGLDRAAGAPPHPLRGAAGGGAPRPTALVARRGRPATDFTPPLGRRGKLITNDDGRIDLKKQGIIPIVNLARFHAIAAGITVSATLERLTATEAAGQLSGEASSELREVFELLLGLRVEQQVAQVERGEQPRNMLDPRSLPT